MADLRELLRQQRAARRVDHPHAAYSEAGKLLCIICHEVVRVEALWDSHVRSPTHNHHLQAAQGIVVSNGSPHETTDDAGTAQSHKRKHNEDGNLEDQLGDEAVRKKRSKPDMASAGLREGFEGPSGSEIQSGRQFGEKERSAGSATARPRESSTKVTPPLLRRISGTPSHGVEIKVPSRPATPVVAKEGTGGVGTFASTTPKAAATGRSPLIPQESASTPTTLPPTKSRPVLSAGQPAPLNPTARDDIDEGEWAAFEAELVHGAPPIATAAPANGQYSHAVIEAAPMSADEVAAQSAAEEREKRKALADMRLEDEKEDATRALETEFEEMEELEARVKRLKDRREALRVPSAGPSLGASVPVLRGEWANLNVVEPICAESSRHGSRDEDEDVDDDYSDDEWESLRFRN